MSVCAALLMYSVVQRLHADRYRWHLPEERYRFVCRYKRSIKASAQILERFNEKQVKMYY